MKVLMDHHPGLDFLKATPEFQDRYSDTVIERIFFTVDVNDDGKITLRELKRSNLFDVCLSLDEEEDINKIRDYFSYEHFYVLYCRFWEIDTDHDFIIDKDDFSRYEGHTLSRKANDRIFEQAGRKFISGNSEKMAYEDFIWFMLCEEDKTSKRSLEYWFKVVDLDGNGIITAYEMEYFYEEQLRRLEYLNQEAVPFKDVVCQMSDMLCPKVENLFTLQDFFNKKAISGVFFNAILNLNKFIAYEQRDPFSVKKEMTENPDFSDWDRFALSEYVRLAMEEENAESTEALDEDWDSDHD
jgi:serine/threonine-protein phosphatase 2A regulatory subunit B''